MKIAILYHSESGNTKKIAHIIQDTANKIDGIDAKAIDINEIDNQFIDESKVVIFGCPTYCGTLSWQLKKYLDTTSNKLSGKLGSPFVTEAHIGGGADFAELTIIGCLLVRGMIVYTGGAAKSPYTHFGAVSINSGDEAQIERVKNYTHKIVDKAIELYK